MAKFKSGDRVTYVRSHYGVPWKTPAVVLGLDGLSYKIFLEEIRGSKNLPYWLPKYRFFNVWDNAGDVIVGMGTWTTSANLESRTYSDGLDNWI